MTERQDPSPPPGSHPASARSYDAFISYRRAEPDRGWAEWLERAIETYHPPPGAESARSEGRRPLRVFRDDAEASASSSLSATIEEALAASRYLIVVASPRSAESEWVDREVRWFVEHGRRRRILVLLVEGTPATAFPPSLRGPGEPLAADVRPPAPPSFRARRRAARLRLVAPLLGVEFDALARRDTVRRRRIARFVSAAGAALLAGAGWLGWSAWSSQRETTETKGALRRVETALDTTKVGKEAADRLAAARDVETQQARADAAEKETARRRAEADRAASVEKERIASEEASRAKADSAAKAEALAAETRRREAEAAARKDAEVGLALDRARRAEESGRPKDALRAVWEAVTADPERQGARILLGRMLRARGALVGERALPMEGVQSMRRATTGGSSWLVGGTAAGFQPFLRCLAGDGSPIGPEILGAFARTDAPAFDASGTRFLARQGPPTAIPSLTLWAAGSDRPLWSLTDQPERVGWSALSPDGLHLLVSRSTESGISVLDAATGAKTGSIEGWANSGAFLTSVRAIVARGPKGIDVVEVPGGEIVGRFDTGADPAGDVLVANERAVVVASYPNGPLLIDPAAGRVTARWKRSSSVSSLAVGSTGAPFVAEVGGSSSLRFHDVRSGKLLRELPAGSGGDSTVSFAVRPGAREVVTHSFDASIRLFEVDGKKPPRVVFEDARRAFGSPNGLQVWAPFSGDGSRVLGLSERGRAIVFEVASLRPLASLAVSPDAVGGGISPAGDEVHVVTANGRFERWSIAGAGEPKDASVEVPANPSVATISPDGALVARATSDGALHVVRVADGAVLCAPVAAGEWITGLAFASRGAVVVAMPRTRDPARVLDVATGRVVRTLDVRRHDPPLLVDNSAMEYIRLASLSGDDVLVYGTNGSAVWSTATGRVVAPLVASGTDTTGVVSEDGSALLVASTSAAEVWSRNASGWSRVCRWEGAAGAGPWIGIRSADGLAVRRVTHSRIEVVPWRENAAPRTIDLPALARGPVELLPTGEVGVAESDGTIRIVSLSGAPPVFLGRWPAPAAPAEPDFRTRPGRDEPTDRRFAADPAGAWIAAIGSDGRAGVFERARGTLLFAGGADDSTATLLLGGGGTVLVRVGEARVDLLRLHPERRPIEELRLAVEARIR